MGRKKTFLLWLICSLLILFLCFPARAGDNNLSGGTMPKRNGQTDIMAGVVVDYMGKLRFLILDRDSDKPIAGASVEIFIPSLDRYVLFGLTDSNGIYELDVAYNRDSFVTDSDQFIKNHENYTFHGALVYLRDNNIQYRVYKAGWIPYPHNGSYLLKGEEIPEMITIKLYQDRDKGSDNKSNGSVPGGNPPDAPNPHDISDNLPPLICREGSDTGVIPKTGVEGTLLYWVFGFVFFLLAGGTIWKLSKSDYVAKETKRRDSDDKI